MAIDLLIGAGASTYGQWVRCEPPAHKTWPFRVTFTSGSPSWSAGNVILEELLGGLPTSPGPVQGNPGLLTVNAQTGTVVAIGTFGPNAPDLEIDAPIEFIRARKDNNIVGTVSVRLLEAA